MTLTIELTPEEEVRLQEEAQRAGLDTVEIAHLLIATGLSPEAIDERRWQREFRRDRDIIAELAEEALQEFERGETVPLDAVLSSGNR